MFYDYLLFTLLCIYSVCLAGFVFRRYAFTLTNHVTGIWKTRHITEGCSSPSTLGNQWVEWDFPLAPVFKNKSTAPIACTDGTVIPGENGLHHPKPVIFIDNWSMKV